MTPPDTAAVARPLDFRWSPTGNGLKAVLRVFDGEDLIDTDTVDLAKTTKRTEFARRLAERTGAALEDVEAELLRITNERSAANDPKPAPEPMDDLGEQTRAALEQTDAEVLEEAGRLLEDPALIDRIGADIESVGVAGEDDLRLTLYSGPRGCCPGRSPLSSRGNRAAGRVTPSNGWRACSRPRRSSSPRK